MKAKDLILVALVCVNATLATIAGAQWLSRAEPAAFARSEMRAGDYILTSGAISATRDALLIIDVPAKRANLYVPKAGAAGGTAWEMTSTRNLAADFAVR